MRETSLPTICMFSNLYPPAATGSSTQCAALARELARRGCQVVVITARLNRESPDYELVEAVHIYRLPSLRLPQMSISLNLPWLSLTLTPANYRRIIEILKRHQAEVIHLHNHMFDLAFSAALAARRLKLPLVITIHTVIKHPRRLYNWLLYPADRLLLKLLVIRRADELICPDVTIEGYVKEAFKQTNTVLLPYGISPMPMPDGEAVRAIQRKYNLLAGPTILSLGHVHEIRNRKELIEVMPRLRERFPGVKLLIVGAIGTRSPEALALRLGVRDAVIFTGAVPHVEIPTYLGSADLEAHWFEPDNPQNKTLGIAALEAMAAGKVVVGTADEDVYGRGVLRNRENVVLVEVDDRDRLAGTLIDLLEDGAWREQIGRRASETIREHFSWASVCANTIAVYERVIRAARQRVARRAASEEAGAG
jgi:1,2-diacylglycerol 3-alpha-glucosyltransferase